ncbi:MAG: hypothetical protein GY839_21430 [candidate division Zixibacteria bacterium]|nr:hypothetical protein [candidate division Zixibacteria bacterium]
MKTDEEIILLLNEDRTDLLLKIGIDLNADFQAKQTEEELINSAEYWYLSRKKELAIILCKDNIIIKSIKLPMTSERQVQLVKTISCIISKHEIWVSSWFVSVLLVKEGLESLCGEYHTGL